MLLFKVAMLASIACASVLPRSYTNLTPRAGQAVDQLLQIAPTSNTCAGATAPDECATNVQAAPFLIAAMSKYEIFSVPEIAAVLSVIAFESGNFKFNTNHFPGRPGQGTRAMFMPNFVLLYARSIPELADKLNAITTASTVDGLSDDKLNAIRALVLPDQYSWASAAWFLTTQCASIRPALQTGSQAGFEAYMGCLGVTATDDRLASWKLATSAFI
ncbi:hypothetical protein ONS95_010355 [Cadophora gregata]|uniref:uncharacterized protein n=1 Tax=Cadophora gregata TaxID=51156 RepID=UPI0026DC5259|nr:uncharacterized protein ONS95_010355 [Cadophora gregata]KAK0122093.1 hypothetical protein ONS95_010355 [Cadophora gregata]KAK0127567.1 hypothetical protein ONS96_007098 [Cadophora gregata f. sp. sojae]